MIFCLILFNFYARARFRARAFGNKKYLPYFCYTFLNYYSMSKIRNYDSSSAMATMKVLEGSRVDFIAHYYPAKGFYAPRYHFENFNLSFAELNYEISRFIRFVCKLTSDPSFGSRLDYADSELDLKYGVEGF